MATYEIDTLKVPNANGTLVEYDLVPTGSVTLNSITSSNYSGDVHERIYTHNIVLQTSSGRYCSIELALPKKTSYSNLSSLLDDLYYLCGDGAYIPCSGNIYVNGTIGCSQIDYGYFYVYDDGEYTTNILELYYHNGLSSTSTSYVDIRYSQDGSSSGSLYVDSSYANGE